MNFIFPAQTSEKHARSVEHDALARRYAMALDRLRNLERYHDALELIRDHSSDLSAVALANNVLMGIQCDFGFIVFPARPKHQ